MSVIYQYCIEIFEEYLDKFFFITENNNFCTTLFMNSFNLDLLNKNEEDKNSSIDDYILFKSQKSINSEISLINKQNDINQNNNEKFINKNSIIKAAINYYFSIINLSTFISC